ncbi:WcaF family extracellular polysaccharide biosynthesis acetyltransferase [Synoicihabitans lomoniglobus]|uniref:WcaF family extracellular polysaccharide biosynthesis acetyltransferase n=1 Tax=Synoicihabitans lomoniglobus TaxID=2909285 RepID=UPI002ED2C929|nr:WcaF family extracellular polysaccharide biosynthesis acetyltransferase [Opitutaceae bacterium LMO-M01]
MTTRVRNDHFDPSLGLERGRGKAIEILWYSVKCIFFLAALPWPSRLKSILLRCFGAKIGRGVVIKPRVNIHFPWKLVIGDHAWIGEEVFILNFERVTIRAHACVSQRAFLCTGNHDFRDPTMPFRNRPIVIGDGVWVGAQVFVAPGITLGEEAIATAGSVVVRDLPPAMVCSGNPCGPIKPRWKVNRAGRSLGLEEK